MRLTFIGCPFRTSYGHYIESLGKAIQAQYGDSIEWVGSNCGCGDPNEVDRIFQGKPSAYFEMRHVGDLESGALLKRWLRPYARRLVYHTRADRYLRMASGSDVMHFQQTLHAFGAMVAFRWLQGRSRAAKVITLHEIEPYQERFPRLNTLYNSADAVIVHCGELRERLLELGVRASKITVLPYGTDIPDDKHDKERTGIVFYGGHHLMSGKGIETVFRATALLRDRLGEKAPRVMIHGHYGTETPEAAMKLAQACGIADRLVWLNQVDDSEIGSLYRSAQIAVLPYTGSFAGLAAGAAAANGTPVIGTRRSGLPEHLGECVVWVQENNPEQLAGEIERLLANPELSNDLTRRAYERAKRLLSWEAVAEKTVGLYRDALKARASVPE